MISKSFEFRVPSFEFRVPSPEIVIDLLKRNSELETLPNSRWLIVRADHPAIVLILRARYFVEAVVHRGRA